MMSSVARMRAAALVAALSALLTVGAAVAQTVSLPPANKPFDYQLGGLYTPSNSVGIVVRDRLVAPAAGKYNICYVNAFQTQPDDSK